jgi:hypothetical protein
MTDPEGSAGDRANQRAVSGSVIGQELLHGHSVALVELDGTPQESDDGRQ